MIDAVLAAEGRIAHREGRRWTRHERNPTQVDRCDKSGEVSQRAAADGNHHGRARGSGSVQLFGKLADDRQALGRFAFANRQQRRSAYRWGFEAQRLEALADTCCQGFERHVIDDDDTIRRHRLHQSWQPGLDASLDQNGYVLGLGEVEVKVHAAESRRRLSLCRHVLLANAEVWRAECAIN